MKKNNTMGNDLAEKAPIKHFLWIMRTTFILLFTCVFCSMAEIGHTQNARVTINKRNSTLGVVLHEIEKQTDYLFIYNNEINTDERISIRAKQEAVSKVLNTILKDKDIDYSMEGNHIILSGRELEDNPKGIATTIVQQQKKQITGIVFDEAGDPIIGANITETGTTNGTVTDVDGRFSLSVEDNASIHISYIGYLEQNVNTSGGSNFNITLVEDSKTLDEVVVIGYGTRTKGALTGAISKVDGKIFESRPVNNTLNVLQGAMPGVVVTRNNGKPGDDGAGINVRGYSSLAGNKPLILIDGISGSLNLINPNDIADIIVLKDAAAAIYGARASDGVVLVTTKKGNRGKPVVTFSGNMGIKKPSYLKQPVTLLHLAEMLTEGYTNIGMQGVSDDVMNKIKAGADPDPEGGWVNGYESYPGFFRDTRWNDVVYGNAIQQIYNVNISGGGENNRYLFSSGYNRDNGLMKYGDHHSDKFNLRMNYDFDLSNWLKIETRVHYENRRITEPTELSTVLTVMPQIWTYIPVYNPHNQFYRYEAYTNPVDNLVNGGETIRRLDRFYFNVKGDLRLYEDLKLVGQLGLTWSYPHTRVHNPTWERHDWKGNVNNISNSPNKVSYNPSYSRYGSYTLYLDYNKTFFNTNHLNLMVGASHEENDYESQNTTGYNLISNELYTLNLADRTNLAYLNISGNASDWALTSFFGRLGYNYNHRYLLDFTLRNDGSSKFSPKNRWSALFPSVTAAWNISEEQFMKSSSIFDVLKLRLSWGKAGNQELSFGNYDYIPLISLQNNVIPIGSPNVGLTGATPTIASEDRTWETITTYNTGVNFEVLNSRLFGGFDYFIKNNNDMLVNAELPAVLGGNAPTQNLGKLRTNGWELSLGWNDTAGQLNYGITFAISDVKTKMIELKGSDTYSEGLIRAREGYSLNSYFGYVSEGIIKTEKQLVEYKKLGGDVPSTIGIGDMMYKDLDGDGKITAFGDDGKSGDMTYLGNILPRYTYSSKIDLAFKNFDFGMLLQGVGKREVIRTNNLQAPFWQAWYQPLDYFYGKTWTANNSNAKYPRIIPGGRGFNNLRDWNWTKFSDAKMNDVSYMRVKSITLGYTIPQFIMQKIKLQNIRIYMSGEDLFTISKGTWGNNFDPEEGWETYSHTTYPFSKIVSFGIDIKF